jgi:SAM-dependent methyltransferase
MFECSKAVMRRLGDARFVNRYFMGQGIDIGAGPDPLGQYREMFPGMQGCRAWDLADGDAQYLEGVPDGSFDFAHSSHCLEHLVDPHIALANWIRVVKPGGHLVIVVPDEDLYEQGVWPSTFNDDHKWTFTVHKASSWSPRSVNVTQMLEQVADRVQVLKVEVLDATFRYYGAQRFDQTLTPIGECAIEIVLRRWLPTELQRMGRLPPAAA